MHQATKEALDELTYLGLDDRLMERFIKELAGLRTTTQLDRIDEVKQSLLEMLMDASSVVELDYSVLSVNFKPYESPNQQAVVLSKARERRSGGAHRNRKPAD